MGGPNPTSALGSAPITILPPAEVRSESPMAGSGNWAVAAGGFLAAAALALLFRGRGRTRVGEEAGVRPRPTELLFGRFDAVMPEIPLRPALAGGRFNPFTALRTTGATATAATVTAAGCSRGSTPAPADSTQPVVAQGFASPATAPITTPPRADAVCRNIQETPGVTDNQGHQLGYDEAGLLYVRVSGSWQAWDPSQPACPATPPGGTTAAPPPPAPPPVGEGSGEAPEQGQRRSRSRQGTGQRRSTPAPSGPNYGF